MVCAQEPTATPTLTADPDQQNLKMERLELENEKLKLRLEKLEFEASKTLTPAVTQATPTDNAPRSIESLKSDLSRKAAEMASTYKDKGNLLVVDFVNAEIWTGAVRYGLYQAQSMSGDRQWRLEEGVNKIGPDGDRRILRRLKNLSWLQYEGMSRGIVIFLAPKSVDDFSLMTPDGLSFGSDVGDVRNAYPNPYFALDGERKEGALRILQFVHRVSWDFSDRLEFGFDKKGKMVKIRYGVLDEH